MSIMESAAALLLRPRILHQLPGRIRFHLPILKRLPKTHGATAELVARLLSVPEGIAEVSPCLTTGNVLVRFDSNNLTSDHVLKYMNTVTQLSMHNRDQLERFETNDFPEIEMRLRNWLSNEVSSTLELDGKLRIPEDVLAQR